MGVPIEPGARIGGKYVIERLLGQGGMGAVFVARQDPLDRQVAIKFLLPEVMGSPGAVARFEREARAAAQLHSDHVARVLDFGRLDSGPPYIVMELLQGEDLASALRNRGALPVPEAVAIILQVCDAIAEAHSLGIVHRDLKPANIFLARRPSGGSTVKVLDFGISKALGETASASLTSSGSMMGSPLYASPEQLRDARTADGRSDVWALGITLYEMLTGSPPFNADSVVEVVTQILTAQPPPIRSRRPDLPASLEEVIMRCLQKDPAARVPSVGDLATAIGGLAGTSASGRTTPETFVAGTLSSGRPIAPAASRPTGGESTSEPVSNTLGQGRQQQRRTVVWLGVAALGVAVIVAGVGVAMRGSPSSPAAAGSGDGLLGSAAPARLDTPSTTPAEPIVAPAPSSVARLVPPPAAVVDASAPAAVGTPAPAPVSHPAQTARPQVVPVKAAEPKPPAPAQPRYDYNHM